MCGPGEVVRSFFPLRGLASLSLPCLPWRGPHSGGLCLTIGWPLLRLPSLWGRSQLAQAWLACAALARGRVASSLSGVLPRPRFLAFLGEVLTQAVGALRWWGLSSGFLPGVVLVARALRRAYGCVQRAGRAGVPSPPGGHVPLLVAPIRGSFRQLMVLCGRCCPRRSCGGGGHAARVRAGSGCVLRERAGRRAYEISRPIPGLVRDDECLLVLEFLD